jgi:hypothetical protein
LNFHEITHVKKLSCYIGIIAYVKNGVCGRSLHFVEDVNSLGYRLDKKEDFGINYSLGTVTPRLPKILQFSQLF